MKLKLLISAALLLLAVGAGAQERVSIDKTKLSYAMGYNLGSELKAGADQIDVEQVIQAIRDASSGTDPRYPKEELYTQLQEFELQRREVAVARIKELSDKNKAESEAFLSSNRSKDGIKVLASGIQYRVIESGAGRKPTLESDVTVHYRSSLTNGREFDSSFARGEPVNFKVNQVIKGWQEILPMMQSGATWQIFVPSEMAYGERGNPQIGVGPNAALIFDINLVDVKS